MIKRNREYLPTATEIKKACERIQGTWNERERKKRAGEKAPGGVGGAPRRSRRVHQQHRHEVPPHPAGGVLDGVAGRGTASGARRG